MKPLGSLALPKPDGVYAADIPVPLPEVADIFAEGEDVDVPRDVRLAVIDGLRK